MARRRIAAAALLAAAAALLVVGQLCNASQSDAEEFWDKILPNSPLPDAILKLLHPDTNSLNQVKDVDAKGHDQLSRLFPIYFGHTSSSSMPSGDESTPEEGTRQLSRLFPIYSAHRRSSPMPSADQNTLDESIGHLSRLFPIYSRHRHSSPMPSDDKNTQEKSTGHMSRLFPFYSRHSQMTPLPSDDKNRPDESTAHLSRLFPIYSRHWRSSQMRSDDENTPDESTRQLSRLFPIYSGHMRSSSMPSDDENTLDEQMGHMSRLFPFYSGHRHSSLMPSGDENTDDESMGHLSRLFPIYSSKDNTIGATVLSVFFFHEEALQVGKNITMYFPPAVTAPLGLLPRNVANSIPFSKSLLLGLLAQLGIAVDSVQAACMQVTLDMCTSPSPGEEAQLCATSLEALVESAIATLGSNDIRPVTSTLSSSGAPLQPYNIRGVRLVEGSSFVACHDLDYPYSVYMCHPTGLARVYMVDMEGASGDMATVVTVCHTDTSKWSPEHFSFKILGTKPGGTPVCHMLPYGNILWAKNVMISGDQHA